MRALCYKQELVAMDAEIVKVIKKSPQHLLPSSIMCGLAENTIAVREANRALWTIQTRAFAEFLAKCHIGM